MKNNYTELYTELRENNGTYAICVDVVSLDLVNKNYSYAAGDAVIAEAVKRIADEATDEMSLIRMGGDEFVILTGKSEEAEAKAILDRIFSNNGKAITFEGNAHTVSLRGDIIKLDTKKVRFGATFTELGHVIGY